MFARSQIIIIWLSQDEWTIIIIYVWPEMIDTFEIL